MKTKSFQERKESDKNLNLESYILPETEVQFKLNQLVGQNNGPSISLNELRETLKNELGDKSLTGELRRLRDEE